MHTRNQRLAIMQTHNYKPTDIFYSLQKAQKLEAVYNCRGKLTVVIASFEAAQDMREGLDIARKHNWRAQQAYSCRTRGKFNRRIEVFTRN